MSIPRTGRLVCERASRFSRRVVHSGVPVAPVPRSRHWYLLEAGYAKRTLSSYKGAVRLFVAWCGEQRLLPRTFAELDECLTEYFHALFDRGDGRGKQLAASTLAGVTLALPRAKNRLCVAAVAVKRWSKLCPAISYPPLTWELAVLVAVQMVRAGHYRFAVGTLLGFDCLLRIGELLSLRCSDVADARDSRLGSEYKQTAVIVRAAKTGTNQSVTIESSDVKGLLRPLLRSTAPASLLFPGGPALYRSVFKSCCASLGLSERYVPHSLRHGGATRLHLRGVPLEDILLRGRWASHKSARTYVQSGRALLLSLQAPPSVSSAAAVLAADVRSAFALAQMH